MWLVKSAPMPLAMASDDMPRRPGAEQDDDGQANRPQGSAATSTRDETSGASSRRTEILEAANIVIARAGLKTSLQDIADQAGILPGSLYFHFDSKDELLVELSRRYYAALDRVGESALLRIDERNPAPPHQQIVDLGCAIARTAFEHRAALQLSFYDGPGSAPDLVRLRDATSVVKHAMAQAIRAGRWSGYLRSDLDVAVLADYLCQIMLRVGLDFIRHNSSSDEVAISLCRIVMDGLATKPPHNDTLDGSAALKVAQSIVESWQHAKDLEPKSTLTHIRAAARTEFGRRGYESTTIRDIASTAGVGQSTVYRLIGSKEDLLISIMRSFGEKVGLGWSRVLQMKASPVEKLDAMSWLSICAVDHFPDEFRIQLAWLRHSPPDTATPGWSFAARISEMEALLANGVRNGELRFAEPLSEVLARRVVMLQWMPENILWKIGSHESLLHVRDTVLRGVANRESV
jgi:AcrR family transcriptional regulator